MAQARPSDYPNIFVGFEIYDSRGFSCGGGTFLKLFFFHFFAEDDHGMPCLSRLRQARAISSNPFCLRNSALDLWLSFCYQSIIPSIEIWS